MYVHHLLKQRKNKKSHWRYIYQNKLDDAYFEHNGAHSLYE